MDDRTCSTVDCLRRATVRGMCGACYQRWRREHAEPCSIAGCVLLQQAGGLCAKHHSRLKRSGTTDDPKRSVKLCGISGCLAPSRARGWCNKHYRRWVLNGDPLVTASDERITAAKVALEKICITCHQVLPLTKFAPRKEMLDGRRSNCRDCQRSYHQKRYAQKRELNPPQPRVQAPRVACSLSDCQRTAVTRGWCKGHYERWRRHGDPETVLRTIRTRRTSKQLEADEKECSRCGRVLSIDFFDARADAPDGKTYACRKCVHNTRIRKRYAEDSDFRDKRAEYYRKYRQKYPEDVKERQRAAKLWLNYGITLADYETLYRAQGGVCKICGSGPHGGPEWARKQWLSVDHCHNSGRIRGLLCDECNIGIGKFRNAPGLLEAAAVYLRTPPGAVI